MTDPTVGRLTSRVIATVAILLLGLGAASIAGLWSTQQAVGRLVDDVERAGRANNAVLQDLTDAETGLRGWSLTGDPGSLAPWERAMASLPGSLARLRSDTAGVPRLADRVEAQVAAVDAWLTGYALPRRERAAGPAGFDAGEFAEGERLFAEIRAIHGETDDVVRGEERDAEADARTAYRVTVATILGLSLIGGVAVLLLARSLTRTVRRPLADLEAVVARLADGDASARVVVSGPREVRAVGNAVNQLADESERAQRLETQVRTRLTELDKVRADFVSNVSHELRTPLTSIGGYLELLREDHPGGSDQAGMWEAIERNVQRLGLLIEDLLALSAVESRSTDLTELDLRGVVEDVVIDLRVVAASRGVRVRWRQPDEAVPVLGDATQLLRAVLNVASNAVKFSPPGGEVALVLGATGDEAVLAVSDEGIGIPTEELGSLGTRFFRGSNAVSQGIAGTGLGVRIVQTTLARHAGTMSYDSVEGRGTTVTLRLPLRQGVE